MSDEDPSRLKRRQQAHDAELTDQAPYAAAVAGNTAQLESRAAIAQRPGSTTLEQQAANVDGNNFGDINTGQHLTAAEGAQIIYAEHGATVVIGEAPIPMSAVDRGSGLGRYLQHIISQNRYLQLQGIRSGGKVVNIELDRIYVTLRASRQGTQRTESGWLANETTLAPGEGQRIRYESAVTDTSQVTVNEALAYHRRLVVLGDPGSGKTTLLRYLALLYARDQAEGGNEIREKLGLEEPGMLPIFLPLRQIGRYLAEHHPQDDGTEGHARLLQFLLQSLRNERIYIDNCFFDDWLTSGNAVVLLDGLDEVADPELRRRVARLVDQFTRANLKCRFVVTSRIVGYSGASQLTEAYAATTVRDFSLNDIQSFLSQWHRLIAIGQMGPGTTAESTAARQTAQLFNEIEASDRIRELAINPLLLTVIALVHRDRVKLPDRRAELYQEAIDVLLGKWDEARGVPDSQILDDRPFDISDRRLVLQQLALFMQESRLKEIDAEPLWKFLAAEMNDAVLDPRDKGTAVKRFLKVIQERTGLLIARAACTYAFSHLTFQEYLAALAIAGRDDYVEYTTRRSGDAWWREVVLLEAGYLSTQSKDRTTRLIRALADAKTEPGSCHNLVLAAECIRDAGANRIVGNLEAEFCGRLKRELEAPAAQGFLGNLKTWISRGMSSEAAIRQRISAAEALGKIGGSRFWELPHGEPEWVPIPAGPFTMGEGRESHQVHLTDYAAARIPITEAQYHLFVKATGHHPPDYWNKQRPPRGREMHPVARVSWHDALAYCRWLSAVTGQAITLPSEAEWEKAARGNADARAYPWGDGFAANRCNARESGFGGTTPAGIIAKGASPYGCLDMAGNVWEWTRSLWGPDWEKPEFVYPYDPDDAERENVDAGDEVLRILRGGSYFSNRDLARCANRFALLPANHDLDFGFRVILRVSPVV